MKAFFRFLYEIIGAPQPPADTPVYRDVVFPNIGLLNLGLSVGLVVVFYLLINRAMGVATFNKGRHWGLFLGLNALLAFVRRHLAGPRPAGHRPQLHLLAGHLERHPEPVLVLPLLRTAQARLHQRQHHSVLIFRS